MIHVKLFRVFEKEMQQSKTRFRGGLFDLEVSEDTTRFALVINQLSLKRHRFISCYSND